MALLVHWQADQGGVCVAIRDMKTTAHQLSEQRINNGSAVGSEVRKAAPVVHCQVLGSARTGAGGEKA